MNVESITMNNAFIKLLLWNIKNIILEYWIVDFRGLGGVQFIGNPKQPTFTVCKLINNTSQQVQYRLGDTISSLLFPNLQFKLDDLMEPLRI